MLDRLDTLVAFATVMLGISLLITILNQMIASLLGHRATYLKDGIKDLLETLDPALAPNVEKIVDDVMTHKLASDSVFAHQAWAPTRWKLASSIRPEELAKLLNLVSAGKAYAPNIQAILSQVNPSAAREAQMIANTVNALAPGTPASADELMKELSDKASKAIGRLEGGFTSTMDRVRQRFTLQMRIWTVVFSVAFALAYHLDAAKIYSQLATDPALRDSLSKASDDLMKKYSEVTAPASPTTGSAARPSNPQTSTQENPTPEQAKKDLGNEAQNLAQAYKQVQSKLSEPKLALFQVPENWGDFGGPGGLFRILATAALLSLGAPFWYNALKGLVNLRSQVADAQAKEAK
ncbi:MAG TPA: hypothetical protein VKY85_05125 [Candidatus Angelobacter sp.]|nr:hypothetical protein [Candidatus Angelobacter sp.]